MLKAQVLALPDTALVRMMPFRNIVSIAAFDNSLAPLQTALGVALPVQPCRIHAGGADYFWAGKKTWLAMADDDSLLSRIETAAKDFAAVTDQSDGKVIFCVSGQDVRNILAKLVPVDLHPAAFPPDATALTLAGHINVQIWREGDVFMLVCFRSFAAALYESLIHAAACYAG